MIGRREFIMLLGGAAAWPGVARAQQLGRVNRIGFLFAGTDAIAPIRIAAFREGLRAAGYREPEQIELIIRVTGGDPTLVAPMARELIERDVDILVPLSPAAVQATTSLTSTIPILAFDLESDPIGSGLVKSLARPGGNVTGVFFDGKAIYTPPRRSVFRSYRNVGFSQLLSNTFFARLPSTCGLISFSYARAACRYSSSQSSARAFGKYPLSTT